ncbi:hypothetical protein ACFE04_023846 [Oxalis oulophora]
MSSIVGLTHTTKFHISIKHSYRLLSSHTSTGKYMALSRPKAVFSNVHNDNLLSKFGNGLDTPRHVGVFFNGVSRNTCQKASVVLSSQQRLHSSLARDGYVVSDIMRRNVKDSGVVVGPLMKNVRRSSVSCLSTGAAHDMSCDGVSRQNSSSDQTIVADQSLKLYSGSCYMPHPDKVKTGGEDAHFICVDEQAIGVADGVGGWADVGVNAGLFAQELMSHSVAAIKEEPEGSISPARVLEKAHSKMKAKGSSTACIIVLGEKGIHAINLGDSGFMIVRDGSSVFQSPVQQHGFNFTYQLESGYEGDLPSSGQVFTIPVIPGDVIVAGTDGLFDNLYHNEVTAVVVDAVREGLAPQATAQKIAALARERALDSKRISPFSAAAHEAGFRYFGGKLDDLTVVVSYITSAIDL